MKEMQEFKIPDDDFGKIVSSVVIGQVTSFVNDHPEVLVKNFTRRRLIVSVSKRIINDLLCS